MHTPVRAESMEIFRSRFREGSTGDSTTSAVRFAVAATHWTCAPGPAASGLIRTLLPLGPVSFILLNGGLEDRRFFSLVETDESRYRKPSHPDCRRSGRCSRSATTTPQIR